MSGVFYWPGRQVVLRGMAGELPADVSRAAFPTRPLGLRRLAWAYDALGAGGSDTVLAHGDVERAFAAAGAARGDAAELDDDPAGARTERTSGRRATTTPPRVKTRFIREDKTWSSHPALP